ncbi:MAG TPA: alcohol dehydrogenase catalytic domain-containing protein [Verrucomicrobiales bacterium]|nr:alcohol dehydrogenase catalytic domain-containing protein [Verrucomicrobiales bacterium]
MHAARAAIADGNGSFTIEDISVGSPLEGEVLVEMRAAGICHTDHASLSWKRPLVMGHEGAGIVRETGAGVSHVRPGDRVVLNWAIPCDACRSCVAGHAVHCEKSRPAFVMERSEGHAQPGGTLWMGTPVDRSFNIGTLSDLTLVKAAAVTRLPENVPFASACITGCGVMTGWGSAVNVARVQRGDSVVVIGCGGVGLNVIQGARLAGASSIIAVDLRDASLKNAKKFGATSTITADAEDREMRAVAAAVQEMTGGRGADFAFEATSVPHLAFVPLLMIRHGGTALQVSGINDPVTVPMPWFMWDKKYVTPLYGDCLPQRDFPRLFEHYQRGELLLDELVTRTYVLDQLSAAMDDMMTGRNAKGVILFPEQS